MLSTFFQCHCISNAKVARAYRVCVGYGPIEFLEWNLAIQQAFGTQSGRSEIVLQQDEVAGGGSSALGSHGCKNLDRS